MRGRRRHGGTKAGQRDTPERGQQLSWAGWGERPAATRGSDRIGGDWKSGKVKNRESGKRKAKPCGAGAALCRPRLEKRGPEKWEIGKAGKRETEAVGAL